MNPYVISLIAACVVYVGLVLRVNNQKEEQVWVHKESVMYAGATGAVTFALWYFLLRNASATYANNNGTAAGGANTAAILTNRPLGNKPNARLNASSMNQINNAGASVVGYTGERVMSEPYK